MLIAQEFIRRLLDVNPTTRMSLTDALRHPWLNSSAPGGSGGDAGQEPAATQHGLDRNLSELSELSEVSEENEHAGANGDASMLSAAPSTDAMFGVDSLHINSPQKVRQPLERRSKVLARELEAEAEAEANKAGATASSSSPTGAKRPRSDFDNNTGSPVVDAAMMTGGESGGDSDGAAMDVVEPQPRAAKRGRRNQDKQSVSPPTAVGGSGDNNNGQGRVLRSRAAAAPQAAAGRR